MNSPLPHQARQIYTTLLRYGPLTAQELGQRLKIFPNAVYRSTETLRELGCVVMMPGYPVRYTAIAPQQAAERISLLARDSFLAMFAVATPHLESPRVNFIKDREALLKKYVEDARRAETDIDLIISGHELPAEVHYENFLAVRRGVKIRAIVQNDKSEIEGWQAIGVSVRISHSIDLRLVIIDRRVVHVLSYDQRQGLSGLGVTFAYPPFADTMHRVFQDVWAEAKPLN